MSSLAFLDIGPVSEGHTQVIPKSKCTSYNMIPQQRPQIHIIGHARTLLDMRDEDLADIGPAIKKVAEMTGAEQYNILQVRCHPYFPVTGYPNFSILQNNGKLAFQVRRLVLVSPLTY